MKQGEVKRDRRRQNETLEGSGREKEEIKGGKMRHWEEGESGRKKEKLGKGMRRTDFSVNRTLQDLL